ncbi:MAG TPA: beta family protein [Candidatus Paceibacterota bacterium]|jgi:hypothetical protein
MTDRTYFPILKGKAGELGAVEELYDDVKAVIAPIIEITDVPWDFQAEDYAKTPEKHIDAFVESLAKKLIGIPFYVDLPESLWDAELEDGTHPLARVFAGIRENGLDGRPVIGADRPTEYSDVVKAIAETDGKGLCFRLSPEKANAENINGLLSLFEVKPVDIDLLIDFEFITPTPDVYLLAFKGVFVALPSRDEWRNIIFGATAFPKDLSDIQSGTNTIPRSEWATWKKITAEANMAGVKFADYAISHPQIVIMDPRIMTMSANIRYTTDEDWMILKGRGVKKHGFGQFTEHCETLIKSTAYKGESFSAGDKIIKECSLKKLGPGNATVWRKVGVNHHLTLVKSQIANPA